MEKQTAKPKWCQSSVSDSGLQCNSVLELLPDILESLGSILKTSQVKINKTKCKDSISGQTPTLLHFYKTLRWCWGVLSYAHFGCSWAKLEYWGCPHQVIPCTLKFETEVVIIGKEWHELINTHLLLGRKAGLEFGDTPEPESWNNGTASDTTWAASVPTLTCFLNHRLLVYP